MALQVKDMKPETSVVVLSMGGETTRDALSRCYAMGADEIIWLCDDAFAGSDTVATTKILARAIEKIDSVDIVLCGEKAVDGETGQVPGGLAERLNIPVIMGVEKICEFNREEMIISAHNDKEVLEMKLKYPAICSFDSFLTDSSRISLLNIKRSRGRVIEKWNSEYIGLEREDCGLSGSKTKVVSVVQNQIEKDGVFIEGTIKEKVEELMELLLNEGRYDRKKVHMDCM